MKFYGGTLLGYLAAFGLKAPLSLILGFEDVDATVFLNDSQYACGKTGFMPLHAAVANGRPEMFNFLLGHSVLLDNECRRAIIDAQPEDKKKDISAASEMPAKVFITLRAENVAEYSLRTSHRGEDSLSGLTPLQLAAKLGDHRMCKVAAAHGQPLLHTGMCMCTVDGGCPPRSFTSAQGSARRHKASTISLQHPPRTPNPLLAYWPGK